MRACRKLRARSHEACLVIEVRIRSVERRNPASRNQVAFLDPAGTLIVANLARIGHDGSRRVRRRSGDGRPRMLFAYRLRGLTTLNASKRSAPVSLALIDELKRVFSTEARHDKIL